MCVTRSRGDAAAGARRWSPSAGIARPGGTRPPGQCRQRRSVPVRRQRGDRKRRLAPPPDPPGSVDIEVGDGAQTGRDVRRSRWVGRRCMSSPTWPWAIADHRRVRWPPPDGCHRVVGERTRKVAPPRAEDPVGDAVEEGWLMLPCSGWRPKRIQPSRRRRGEVGRARLPPSLASSRSRSALPPLMSLAGRRARAEHRCPPCLRVATLRRQQRPGGRALGARLALFPGVSWRPGSVGSDAPGRCCCSAEVAAPQSLMQMWRACRADPGSCARRIACVLLSMDGRLAVRLPRPGDLGNAASRCRSWRR